LITAAPPRGTVRDSAPARAGRRLYDFSSRRGLGEGVLTHTITLIPGDGTGPEIVAATRRAIEATGVKIEWDVHEIGMPAMAKHGTPFPREALDSVRRNRVALKGPLTTELGTGFRSVNVALRKEFDLYANLRPAKTYPGVPAPRGDVDLVVVRENIEDLYAGIEFDVDSPEEREVQSVIERVGKATIREHSALAIKAISVEGSRRIVKFAFDYARTNKRKKVTAIHKANIMKFADGLFLRIAGEVAKDYPEIGFEDRIVDNMCMQLVVKPDLYDVLVAPNLYGDIVSDLVAGLVGGLGVAPGANIGADGIAMFEAIHGSAPKYAGLNKVNPMALMLAGVLMLRHIGEREAGDRLEQAIASVVAEGKDVTYDLKADRDDPSAVGTKEFADAVIKRMRN
jgi:isocitrate dehydrogenase (NAD+)